MNEDTGPELTAEQSLLYKKLTIIQRHFVKHLLAGKKNGPAYAAACKDLGKPVPTQPSQTASDCLLSPKVKAFLASVHDKTMEKQVAGVIATREEALERMSRILRAKHPGKLKRVTALVDGVERELTVIDLPEEMDDDQRAALEEMTMTATGPKVKLLSPIDAAKAMAQMENWNKQQEQKNTEIHIHMSDAQLRL